MLDNIGDIERQFHKITPDPLDQRWRNREAALLKQYECSRLEPSAVSKTFSFTQCRK